MVYRQWHKSQSLKVSNNVFGKQRHMLAMSYYQWLLIPSSKQPKLLGVNIDNSLKFETHFKDLRRKVTKKVHKFGRL